MSFLANLFLANQESNSLKTSIHADIDTITTNIKELKESYQRPFIFLKSSRAALSSNVANDVMIYAGPPVPQGFRGVITDFNLTFGTVAGTVKWVIVDSNGQILTNVVTNITAGVNGSGATVIEEGYRFAVVGQVAGAGVFDTYCTGYIYKVF